MSASTVNDPRALMLEYLAERGISEAQADAAGFVPLDRTETMGRAGTNNALGRCSFEIPYFDLDGNPTGHSRLKFLGVAVGFKPTKDRKKAPKFWQEPGTGTPAYLPRGYITRSLAADPSIDLNATEGEVKALAATLRGIPTIAFGGVDTWHVGGDPTHLVAGLDSIVLQGRNVGVVFDSDAATKDGVRRAEAALCAALDRSRAFPQVIRLPPTKDGKNQGLDDYLVSEGPEAFRRLVDGADRLPDALDSAATLLDTEYPPIEFAIEPYLPQGELVEIHGAHGQFKSTIMLYAALSVATGEPWGGVRVAKRGRAVFISLEDKASTLAVRVRRWLRGGSKATGEQRSAADVEKLEKAVRANFAWKSREKAGALVLTGTAYGQTLVRQAVVDRLVKLCAGASLVVLETAARLHPGAEDNESLSVLASTLERIATRTGACVVLVRHIAKERATSGKVDSYGGRGGGSLADASRSVLSVVREGDSPTDPVKLVHTKSTHSAPGTELVWRPQQIDKTVFLKAMTQEEKRNVAASKLLDRVRHAGEEGITWGDLAKKLKGSKDASEGKAALDRLLAEKLVETIAVKGPRGPAKTLYRVALIAKGKAA